MILSFLIWYFLIGCGYSSAKWAVEFEMTRFQHSISAVFWPLELVLMIGIFILLMGGCLLLWITGQGFSVDKPTKVQSWLPKE
jgi:hypothetical protein